METEHSVSCSHSDTSSDNNNGSSSGNAIASTNNAIDNNNILIKTDCKPQSSNSVNASAIDIECDDDDDDELKSKNVSQRTSATATAPTRNKSNEFCDNGDSGGAVAFATIQLNNNESNIGFVDDEDDIAGVTDDAPDDDGGGQGACCKPDIGVEDGKRFGCCFTSTNQFSFRNFFFSRICNNLWPQAES